MVDAVELRPVKSAAMPALSASLELRSFPNGFSTMIRVHPGEGLMHVSLMFARTGGYTEGEARGEDAVPHRRRALTLGRRRARPGPRTRPSSPRSYAALVVARGEERLDRLGRALEVRAHAVAQAVVVQVGARVPDHDHPARVLVQVQRGR